MRSSAGSDRSRTPRHSARDIGSLSIFYSCMDRSVSYSFYLVHSGDVWSLDAECFTIGNARECIFKDHPLDPKDSDELLSILEQTDAVMGAKRSGKRVLRSRRALDGDKYGFFVTFSDGECRSNSERQTELEKFCYRLAEEYCAGQNN